MNITRKIQKIETDIYKAIRRDARRVTDNWYHKADSVRDLPLKDSRNYYKDFFILANQVLKEDLAEG